MRAILLARRVVLSNHSIVFSRASAIKDESSMPTKGRPLRGLFIASKASFSTSRESLINDALENVKVMGWKEEAVKKALQDSNSHEKLTLDDIVSRFVYNGNVETLEEIKKDPSFVSLSTQEQLVEVIMRRVLKNEPYKQHFFEYAKLFLQPTAARNILTQFFSSSIWDVIKDTTPDEAFKKRKDLIVSAYLSTELFYSRDTTDDKSTTRKMAQDRITELSKINVDEFKSMADRLRQDPSKQEATMKMLNTLVVAMEKAKTGDSMGAIKDLMADKDSSKQILEELMKMKGQSATNSIFDQVQKMKDLFKK